jgi:hypothetical protein
VAPYEKAPPAEQTALSSMIEKERCQIRIERAPSLLKGVFQAIKD